MHSTHWINLVGLLEALWRVYRGRCYRAISRIYRGLAMAHMGSELRQITAFLLQQEPWHLSSSLHEAGRGILLPTCGCFER